MLNAPSAKKRRNILGNANATWKASATGPEPKKAAISMSRRKPMMRDNRVQLLTVKKLASSRIFLELLVLVVMTSRPPHLFQWRQ